jgi:hypothetical protein
MLTSALEKKTAQALGNVSAHLEDFFHDSFEAGVREFGWGVLVGNWFVELQKKELL